MGSAGLVSVSYFYIDSYKVSAESRAGEWELSVIDNEKSWSLRADARRRIVLYYQTQVSLQKPDLSLSGLDPVSLSKIETHLLASLGSKGKNRNSLACLRNAGFYSAVTYCSTAEQVFYTWVARSRSGCSSFTASALNKPSSSSSSSVSFD